MVFDGKRFVLGVNYWPRRHGVNMWNEWAPDEIDAEFREMRSIGVNLARVFTNIRDFQPIHEYASPWSRITLGMSHDESVTPEKNPRMIDPVMVKRFDELIKIAKKNGVFLEPALITGWMSGLFIEPAYRNGRNMFSDPFMLRWQSNFVKFFAERYKDEKQIAAWALGNECNCMDKCESEDAAWLWTSTLVNAIRAEDKNHPVISSMHGMNPVNQNLWKVRDQGELCDILTTHPYPAFTPGCNLDRPADMRSVLHAAAESEFVSGLGGRPAFCEETGTLGDACVSREESAKFLRLRLHSLLAQNNVGCAWWCHSDFTCGDRGPYRWILMENSGLGLFTADGKAKPVAEEYKRFSSLLDEIGGSLPPSQKDAVIIVPRDPHRDWTPYFNAYILCKRAGIECAFRWEYDDISEYKLAICPSVSSHNPYWADGWENIKSFVKDGGTLYLSYNGGSLTEMNELFGINFSYKHKKVSGPAEWAAEFSVSGGKPLINRADGTPSLVVNKFGKGKALFYAEPAELALSAVPMAYDSDRTDLVYRAAGKEAGITPAAQSGDPNVQVSAHKLSAKSSFIQVINYGYKDKTVTVTLDRAPKSLEPVGGVKVSKTSGGFKMSLPAAGAGIARVSF